MTSVGEVLRSARESQGRGTAEIADELCLTQRYLQALESDDLSNLPGIFFYKSFVKQYAETLGVPMSKLQAGIDLLTRVEVPPETAVAAERPTPSGNAIRVLDPLVEASNLYFSNRRIGIPVAVLAVALLACSGFYSWWSQPPRQKTRAAETTGTGPAGQRGGASRVEVSATADPNDVNHVVLNLSATEQVWLSITNNEGKQIFSGILQPSQTKTLTASDSAQMKVGNAGGIEVRLNGKEIGPLGGRGQVKTVLFTAPDKVQIMEPPAAPADAAL